MIHVVLLKPNGPVLRKGQFCTFYTEDSTQLAVTYSKSVRIIACPTMTVRNKSKTKMTLTEVKHKGAESSIHSSRKPGKRFNRIVTVQNLPGK